MMCIVRNAAVLSSHLDYEVVNNQGKQFRYRKLLLIELLVDEFSKRFSGTPYLKEAADQAKAELKSSTFQNDYLSDAELARDIELEVKEARFSKPALGMFKLYQSINGSLANH